MTKRDRIVAIASRGIPLLPWILLAPNLPPVGAAAVPAGIVAGLVTHWRGAIIPTPLLTFLSAIVTILTLTRITLADPVTPLATLLQLLLGIRLAGERSGRSTLQIVALSILSLAVASLWELGIRYLAIAILSLVTAGGLLTLVTFSEELPPDDPAPIPPAAIRIALLLPLSAIPLAVFLFPLLPRTQHPLWNILPAAGGSRTGAPDRVEPGRSSTVGDDPGVVFRAETSPLPPERLYWRVRVFNRREGSLWLRDPSPPLETPVAVEGKGTPYRILMSGGGNTPLPTLDYPLWVSLPRAQKSGDGEIIPTGVRPPTLRFEGRSVERMVSRPDDPERFHTFYTALPSVDPRFLDAGRKIARQAAGGRERLALLVSLFRRSSLRYGTSGLAGGEDPAATFFFEGGTGNCEHFASAFATIARGGGIPARVVGGYLGGDFNPFFSYYLVRGSHAHVWVEVWLDGEGWVRVDPTSFADRFRSEREGRRLSFATRAAALADSLDYWWSQGVINYDVERQITTITRVGRLISPERLPLGKGVIGTAVIGGLVTLLLLSRRKGSRPAGRGERLLHRLERILQRQGHSLRRESEGINEYAGRIGDPRVERFARLYGEGVYREGGIDGKRYRELVVLVKEIGSARPGKGPPPVKGDDPDSGDGKGRGDGGQ